MTHVDGNFPFCRCLGDEPVAPKPAPLPPVRGRDRSLSPVRGRLVVLDDSRDHLDDRWVAFLLRTHQRMEHDLQYVEDMLEYRLRQLE